MSESEIRPSDECLAWYEAGLTQGIALGRRQLEAEWAESHEVAARIARMVAEAPSFEELCRRRGDNRRADHQRRILQARGMIA